MERSSSAARADRHSPHLVAAGVILGISGAIWSAVGAVLLVLAWLYGNPASLPDWVATDPLVGGSAGGLMPIGLLAVGIGLGQVTAGLGVARRSGRWAPVLGLILAALGVGVTGVWLISGLTQGRPAHVLLPALLAYLYAAWVLAIRGEW